ncbi:transposase [Nonomuraea sp. K274]|uniref:Transposase n=1 Tax=Nonomuraea cypriaca TaxID=1187855 RepID=A0A931A7M3_9ACTN|nr:integrase core domain-containing protein [Nonomuraea cypriaca]MBF8184292.1 transposase [Nonomuraea cypriaca]
MADVDRQPSRANAYIPDPGQVERPDPDGCAAGVTVSFRGGADEVREYTASLFRQACARMGVRQSMGRMGSALGNAAAESLFSSMEFELLRAAGPFAAHAQTRRAAAAWVDDFNRERLRTALGMRTPIDYEQAAAQGRTPKEAA